MRVFFIDSCSSSWISWWWASKFTKISSLCCWFQIYIYIFLPSKRDHENLSSDLKCVRLRVEVVETICVEPKSIRCKNVGHESSQNITNLNVSFHFSQQQYLLLKTLTSLDNGKKHLFKFSRAEGWSLFSSHNPFTPHKKKIFAESTST